MRRITTNACFLKVPRLKAMRLKSGGIYIIFDWKDDANTNNGLLHQQKVRVYISTETLNYKTLNSTEETKGEKTPLPQTFIFALLWTKRDKKNVFGNNNNPLLLGSDLLYISTTVCP
jgi:hypothetical protein